MSGGVADLRLVVVTDRRQARAPLLEVVRSALDGGATTVLLRETDLARAERFALAEAIRAMGAYLIVAGPDPLGGDAVHLASDDPVSSARLTGRSCHDKADVMASKEDYVTLSPIFGTPSKPGYGPALGLAPLSIIATGRTVLALGGIDGAARAGACREAGAAGVAVMGAIMRAPDPGKLVRELREAVA